MISSGFVTRLGLGLLFVWGGLEKFFEGFMGGVGLDKMAGFLGKIGFGFLGESGLLVLAFILSLFELIAGILLIINKYTKPAAYFAAFIMLIALVMVRIPAGKWMSIMIHIALFTSYLGIALRASEEETVY